jgi:hypothetical protein
MTYISDVVNLLISRSKNITFLTANDFALIAEWEKQEIPLEIVLKTINETLDDLYLTNSENDIDSLTGFRSIVKTNYVEWLQKSKGVA